MSGDLRLTTIEIVNSKTGQTQVLDVCGCSSASSVPCRGPTGWPQEGDRNRLKGVRSQHRAGPGPVAYLGREAATVSARNQPAGRVRGRAGALRLGQTRRVGRRRGSDGSPVRARVSEGDVMQISSKPPPAGRTLFPGNPPLAGEPGRGSRHFPISRLPRTIPELSR